MHHTETTDKYDSYFQELAYKSYDIREIRTHTGYKIFYNDLMNRLLMEYSSLGDPRPTPQNLLPQPMLSSSAQKLNIQIRYSRIKDIDHKRESNIKSQLQLLNVEYIRKNKGSSDLEGELLEKYKQELRTLAGRFDNFFYRLQISL
jgi:hypothetical protein